MIVVGVFNSEVTIDTLWVETKNDKDTKSLAQNVKKVALHFLTSKEHSPLIQLNEDMFLQWSFPVNLLQNGFDTQITR